jgi:hypothetical protein
MIVDKWEAKSAESVYNFILRMKEQLNGRNYIRVNYNGVPLVISHDSNIHDVAKIYTLSKQLMILGE